LLARVILTPIIFIFLGCPNKRRRHTTNKETAIMQKYFVAFGLKPSATKNTNNKIYSHANSKAGKINGGTLWK